MLRQSLDKAMSVISASRLPTSRLQRIFNPLPRRSFKTSSRPIRFLSTPGRSRDDRFRARPCIPAGPTPMHLRHSHVRPAENRRLHLARGLAIASMTPGRAARARLVHTDPDGRPPSARGLSYQAPDVTTLASPLKPWEMPMKPFESARDGACSSSASLSLSPA